MTGSKDKTPGAATNGATRPSGWSRAIMVGAQISVLFYGLEAMSFDLSSAIGWNLGTRTPLHSVTVAGGFGVLIAVVTYIRSRASSGSRSSPLDAPTA